MHVGGLGGHRRHLAALARLLLNLGNLLALLARGRDLRAEDDVADLTLGQGLWGGKGAQSSRSAVECSCAQDGASESRRFKHQFLHQ